MEPQSEPKTPFLKQPFINKLAVIFLSIVGVVATLLVTRGSQFCLFTIGSCVTQASRPNIGADLLPVAAGVTAAVVLVVMIEAPVLVAIGIAIVLGLMTGQFLG